MPSSWQRRWKKTAGGFLLCILTGAGCLVSPLPGSFEAQAYEVRPVARPDGSPLFELHFFDKGEYYGEYEDETMPGYSPWQLSAAQKQAIAQAAGLWAEVLGPGSRNSSPLPITVGTFLEENAGALSEPNQSADSVLNTGIQDGILHGITPDEPGLILVGPLDMAIPERLSPIPVTGGQADIVTVLYHEIGHALGIYSLAGNEERKVSTWDTHLKNSQGFWLKPGMEVVKEGDAAGSGNVFVVGEGTDSGVRFHGKHVAEVMGNDGGLLIEGYEGDTPDLSHIELERSLMSHQNYRNYTTFMEAELAALQDIGYNIDRKNFFGYSVYGDGLTLTNANGYFARNESGTGWLEGQANTATLGVGLHIYGKHNDVTQAADLLAGGVAGTGIRVDGSNNTLRINPDVLVAANGLWGTGLLVAYGKEQTVINRGTIQALGEDGVAARFDFGGNILGNDTEYRGSWIWTGLDEEGNEVSFSIPDNDYKDSNGFDLNLDGALVSSFDVSGTLAGSAASIYIAENAWVQKINILSGANVSGSIISDWDPEDERIQYTGNLEDLHTQLTFGLAPQADGSAGTQADPDFDMTLNGSIIGAPSIDMELTAGHLAVTGIVDVYSLNNSGHLTLTGMDDSGRAAHVGTTFVNNAGATLETGFTADGQVAGIEADSARLDGTWLLRPLRDFYANQAVITPESPVSVSGGTLSGNFSNVALVTNLSPTLDFTLNFDAANQPQIDVSRAADAYSRHAATAGAASLGHALAGIADVARGDMQELLAALDWSARDGGVVRQALDQLGPEAYDASARAALAQQAEFNVLLLRRMLGNLQAGRSLTAIPNNRPDAPDADSWQAWATPYGAGSRQGSRGDASGWQSTGIGLLAGMDRRFDSGLALGFHMGLAARRTSVTGAHDATAETQSALAGIHGLLAPEDWNGFYLTAQARLGLEDGEMNRTVAFNGYVRHNESRWTGLTGSALLGGGKDWTLSAGDGLLHVGPTGWMEYAFLRRPGISESDGEASRLHIDARTYESLQLSLGAHAGWSTELENGSGLGLDVLAAWRHELLDGTFHTAAAFRDYGDRVFRSSTDLTGRDALLVQGSLRLTHASGFFAQIDAGGEFFRTSAASANTGLSFGWEF